MIKTAWLYRLPYGLFCAVTIPLFLYLSFYAVKKRKTLCVDLNGRIFYTMLVLGVVTNVGVFLMKTLTTFQLLDLYIPIIEKIVLLLVLLLVVTIVVAGIMVVVQNGPKKDLALLGLGTLGISAVLMFIIFLIFKNR